MRERCDLILNVESTASPTLALKVTTPRSGSSCDAPTVSTADAALALLTLLTLLTLGAGPIDLKLPHEHAPAQAET